jgi:hypothetical protein
MSNLRFLLDPEKCSLYCCGRQWSVFDLQIAVMPVYLALKFLQISVELPEFFGLGLAAPLPVFQSLLNTECFTVSSHLVRLTVIRAQMGILPSGSVLWVRKTKCTPKLLLLFIPLLFWVFDGSSKDRDTKKSAKTYVQQGFPAKR